MSGSEQKSNSENSGNSEPAVVSVTKHGQATIPKRFREQLGIEAPGKVQFRETANGEVVVERVRSAGEMQGFAARSGEATTDESASELLREKREQDLARRDDPDQDTER